MTTNSHLSPSEHADVHSYPAWAPAMVAECEDDKRSVTEHGLWRQMIAGDASPETIFTLMAGTWPVIERFPLYMARSLIKTRYGRSSGDDTARRWLVHNIRVEQNHAEYWLRWAEGDGIRRAELVRHAPPGGTQDLACWCQYVSDNDTLAASIAAVNYAVEGATGEWARKLYDSAGYRERFPAETRRESLRWLKLHAAYDDAHPWEALEIVCTLLGDHPSDSDVWHVTDCVKSSYARMRMLADKCVAAGTRANEARRRHL